jgi:hypothetical protein
MRLSQRHIAPRLSPTISRDLALGFQQRPQDIEIVNAAGEPVKGMHGQDCPGIEQWPAQPWAEPGSREWAHRAGYRVFGDLDDLVLYAGGLRAEGCPVPDAS